ncbi:MAG: 50S ribosomal protein L18 [Bacteroidales bacterium]|nr:50S ribosomal protein L18 [Bacteroidales bacterium]MCF6341769.1 50S ribosomal protein L18 [Bacteroidales bacterium]
MGIKNKKAYRRNRIKMRVRKTVNGSSERPRMTVFRSNKQIYVQLIDDLNGKTIVSASSRDKGLEDSKMNKIQQAEKVGGLVAEKAKAAGVSTVVFDRNGYLYHGRVKSLAEAARKGGLKF